jgi:zinc protease
MENARPREPGAVPDACAQSSTCAISPSASLGSKELAKVKRAQTLSLPGRWETASSVLGDIAELVSYDLDDDYWDTYPQRVRNLTVQQVADAANEIIVPDNLLWVVVGDRRKIEAEIRELGIGDITLLDADGQILAESPP